MIRAADFQRLALALPGTTAAPHFDRTAFKAARIFASLAPDGLTANLRFTPEDQALKCAVMPEGFTAIPNAWGRQGWTCATLAALDEADAAAALEIAWRHAQPPEKKKKKKPAAPGA